MAKRIKKDDMVVAISGKDKGKTGRVLEVQGDRVLVEGINVVKRHQKPQPPRQMGGIVEKEAPIHVSNVMPQDPKTEQPTRVRVGTDKDGKKVRITLKSHTVLDG